MIPKLLIKTINFLGDNLLGIILVICLFSAITVLIVVNNITFPKKKKTKVDKVIIVEKMTSQIDFHSNANSGLQTNEACGKLETKEGCCSLGTCVWATASDKNEKINKCIAAAGTMNPSGNSSIVPGSLGPATKCYKNPEGKYIGWEKYYYQDGDTIKEKNGTFMQQCKDQNTNIN